MQVRDGKAGASRLRLGYVAASPSLPAGRPTSLHPPDQLQKGLAGAAAVAKAMAPHAFGRGGSRRS
jgi:hypothetical protein